MIRKLFDLIAMWDAAITRDRAIVAAAMERIERNEQRRAWAQWLLGKQRTGR